MPRARAGTAISDSIIAFRGVVVAPENSPEPTDRDFSGCFASSWTETLNREQTVDVMRDQKRAGQSQPRAGHFAFPAAATADEVSKFLTCTHRRTQADARVGDTGPSAALRRPGGSAEATDAR